MKNNSKKQKANRVIKTVFLGLLFCLCLVGVSNATELLGQKMPFCNDSRIILKLESLMKAKDISQKSLLEQRQEAILLRKIASFFELEERDAKNNVELLDYILMLKINQKVDTYRVCKNGDIYTLIYPENMLYKVAVFGMARNPLVFEY